MLPELENGEWWVAGCSFPCFEMNGKLYYGIGTNKRLVLFDGIVYSIYREDISSIKKGIRKLTLHFLDGSKVTFQEDNGRLSLIQKILTDPESVKFAFFDKVKWGDK